MPFRVVYSRRADSDLQDLFDFVESRATVKTASNYLQRIQTECERLAHTPFRGSLREEHGPDVRAFGFERRATIYFRVYEEMQTVVILAIAYGGRQIVLDE